MKSDLELFQRYSRDKSEEAFAEIVRRHLDLVYSAARRQVHSPQLAEEIAQSAFADLAHNAHRLAPDTILSAWLYQVTRRTAIDVIRRESRRHLREQTASEMNAINATPDDWAHIEPLLDDAMAALEETDRAAVLLRYFENKPLREVGQQLGVSEDAAQKRVSRAVDRLREFFARRDCTVGTTGFMLAISSNAVQAAPVGLAAVITSTSALAGTTATAALAAQTTMNWMSLKMAGGIAAAAIAAGTATHFMNERQNSHLRDVNQNLIAEQTQFSRERDAAISAASASQDELDRLRSDQSELLRLRSEVGMLRRQTNELARLREQNTRLRASLAEAAQGDEPEAATDPERQAEIAKMNEAKLLLLGLHMYANDNGNQWPTDLNQTSNYLASADTTLLTQTNQFELVIQGSLAATANPGTTLAVREKEPWFSIRTGKWSKVYGFADGHAELRTEPPEGFEEWEKQHIVSLP